MVLFLFLKHDLILTKGVTRLPFVVYVCANNKEKFPLRSNTYSKFIHQFLQYSTIFSAFFPYNGIGIFDFMGGSE
ncbi:hypothetical protein NP92_06180 [Anoxybacillus gonensis]|nr:hypothetical protein AFK25_06115 [Anoxybacillus gonensis]KGP60807.1 hypothetical protein NP92_06180 [Anoxybacillus gonensis]